MAESQVQVYVACSLDGFIAGPDHDLSWLPGSSGEAGDHHPEKDPGALEWEDFIQDIGAMLMGRSTYDVVRGFDVPWPYGEMPVCVATRRELDPDPPATVQAVTGTIDEVVGNAREAAGGKDVYLDGGNLIRQAAEANLVDRWIVTYAPVVLGKGISLFAGLENYYNLEITGHYRYAFGMVQIHARPLRR